MYAETQAPGLKKYGYALLKSKLLRRLINPRFGKVERVNEGNICIVLSKANRLGDLVVHNFLLQQLDLWGYSVVFGVSASFYRKHQDFFRQHCLTKKILILPTHRRQWPSFIIRTRKERISAVIMDAQPMVSPAFFYLAGVPAILGLRGANLSFCSAEYEMDKANTHYTTLVNSILRLLDPVTNRKNQHAIMPFFPFRQAPVKQLKGIKNKFLAMHIGGSDHWNRKWPFEKFLLLAQQYLDNYEGALVLVGGKEEQAASETLRNILEVNCGAEGRVINCCGTDLNTTAAILHRCDVFVGNDSGPMHIANALNKRVIVICGPSAIAAVNPTMYDKRNFTVHLDLACIPCLDRVCRLPEGQQLSCLNDLDVEMIWEKLQSVIRVSAGATTK